MAKVLRGIEAHAASALDDRFDNDRGDLIMMSLDQAAEVGDVAVLPVLVAHDARGLGEELLRKDLRKEMMHARFGITDRHGAGRIAVITAPDRQHPLLAWLPHSGPVLDRQ